ncbi:MAG: GtrA family protein [Alphaproteobacteria bacterium]
MISAPPGEAPAALRPPRLLLFAYVGVANTATDFAVFMALVGAAHWLPAAANICSYSIAICASFILNRNITFRQSIYRHRTLAQFVRFAIVNLAALALSTALVHFFVGFTSPVIAKLMSIPATLAWGFICSRHFVFVTPGEKKQARRANASGGERAPDEPGHS